MTSGEYNFYNDSDNMKSVRKDHPKQPSAIPLPKLKWDNILRKDEFKNVVRSTQFTDTPHYFSVHPSFVFNTLVENISFSLTVLQFCKVCEQIDRTMSVILVQEGAPIPGTEVPLSKVKDIDVTKYFYYEAHERLYRFSFFVCTRRENLQRFFLHWLGFGRHTVHVSTILAPRSAFSVVCWFANSTQNLLCVKRFTTYIKDHVLKDFIIFIYEKQLNVSGQVRRKGNPPNPRALVLEVLDKYRNSAYNILCQSGKFRFSQANYRNIIPYPIAMNAENKNTMAAIEQQRSFISSVATVSVGIGESDFSEYGKMIKYFLKFSPHFTNIVHIVDTMNTDPISFQFVCYRTDEQLLRTELIRYSKEYNVDINIIPPSQESIEQAVWNKMATPAKPSAAGSTLQNQEETEEEDISTPTTSNASINQDSTKHSSTSTATTTDAMAIALSDVSHEQVPASLVSAADSSSLVSEIETSVQSCMSTVEVKLTEKLSKISSRQKAQAKLQDQLSLLVAALQEDVKKTQENVQKTQAEVERTRKEQEMLAIEFDKTAMSLRSSFEDIADGLKREIHNGIATAITTTKFDTHGQLAHLTYLIKSMSATQESECSTPGQMVPTTVRNPLSNDDKNRENDPMAFSFSSLGSKKPNSEENESTTASNNENESSSTTDEEQDDDSSTEYSDEDTDTSVAQTSTDDSAPKTRSQRRRKNTKNQSPNSDTTKDSQSVGETTKTSTSTTMSGCNRNLFHWYEKLPDKNHETPQTSTEKKKSTPSFYQSSDSEDQSCEEGNNEK